MVEDQRKNYAFQTWAYKRMLSISWTLRGLISLFSKDGRCVHNRLSSKYIVGKVQEQRSRGRCAVRLVNQVRKETNETLAQIRRSDKVETCALHDRTSTFKTEGMS